MKIGNDIHFHSEGHVVVQPEFLQSTGIKNNLEVISATF